MPGPPSMPFGLCFRSSEPRPGHGDQEEAAEVPVERDGGRVSVPGQSDRQSHRRVPGQSHQEQDGPRGLHPEHTAHRAGGQQVQGGAQRKRRVHLHQPLLPLPLCRGEFPG